MPESLDPLLLRFLELEATPHVCSLLRASLAEADADPKIAERHFNFNLYDVDIDFSTGTVTVVDILRADAAATVPLSRFRAAIATVAGGDV